MDEDTKKVIEDSQEAIKSLEDHIEYTKKKRSFQLVVSILCMFGLYAFCYYSMWLWGGVCLGIAMYNFMRFNSKDTESKIEEMEKLLENAKFNESYLKACAIEDGDSWI